MDAANQEATPLHLHTITSLCNELSSGGSVLTGKDGEVFKLNLAASRSILSWYMSRPAKWASPVQLADMELIVSAMATPVTPTTASQAVQGKPEHKTFKLKSITAHRFAGIHVYGTATNPPPDFHFDFTNPVTLLEGGNGSGKTSLVNAIAWCLTGMLIRPQRPPELASNEFPMRYDPVGLTAEESTQYKITPVTPLPMLETYQPSSTEKNLCIDTWVELTLTDGDGAHVTIKRAQARNTRGAVVEAPPNLQVLGLDPLAFQISTLMPAMIPYIKLGSASELGAAVAKLTGLADLVNLARHAKKTQERIPKELVTAKLEEIRQLDLKFNQARGDLAARLAEFPAIAPSKQLPSVSDSKEVEQELLELRQHFDHEKAQALTSVRSVLGPTFDPNLPEASADIENNIGAAMGQIAQIGRMANADRLRTLGRLTVEDLTSAEALLDEIVSQAQVIANLAREPNTARRYQLYATIATWIKGDHESVRESVSLENCVVCGESLIKKNDPETGLSVILHLEKALDANEGFIGQTVSDWVATAQGRLLTNLPEALQREITVELPGQPSDLIRQLIEDDLFSAECFSGHLSAMKLVAQQLCESSLSALPPLPPIPVDVMSAVLGDPIKPLAVILSRLRKAIAFARWRNVNERAVGEVFIAIIGRPSSAKSSGLESSDGAPRRDLTSQLEAIQIAVEGAAPLTAVLEQCNRMDSALRLRREKEARIVLYREAVIALAPIVDLGTLAEKQVDGLRAYLQEGTRRWLALIYQKTQSAGHDLVGLDVTTKGELGVMLGGGGASAPAEHIANASALRATLVGFFFAFWEYVLKERGGLNFLLLDDPQELLDEENKLRLAEAIPTIIEDGQQLLITTHDREFARYVATELRRLSKHADHRAVFPANAYRLKINLPLSKDGLNRKRDNFEHPQNKDNPVVAQEYALELRIFIESRFGSIFDDPAYAISLNRMPALSDHVGRIQSKVREKSPFFCSPYVVRIAESPLFSSNSKALKLLNQSHHPEVAKITYMHVLPLATDLKNMSEMAEGIHEEFRRWRKQEQGQQATTNVLPFKPLQPTPFEVERLTRLAAFSGSARAFVGFDNQETFSSEWFKGKALLRLNTHNFGFSAPINSLVIVESNPTEAKDNDLVIALHDDKVSARRMLRSPKDVTRVTLAAETTNPTKRPPTIVLPAGAVTTYRVRGVLFDKDPPAVLGSKQDAIAVESAVALLSIKVAFGVKDDSALPLALPGQTLLGGESVAPAELGKHEGQLVAISLDDGQNLFKRISYALPGALSHVRQFESIGGFGDSFLAATEFLEGRALGFPLVEAARLVVGVLYE